MMKRTSFFSFVMLILSLGFFSCSSDDGDKVGNFNIERNESHLVIGDEPETVYVTGGSGKYTVNSSDESVATVVVTTNNNGHLYFRITAEGKGKTTITIRNGRRVDSFDVVVVNPYLVYKITGTGFFKVIEYEIPDIIPAEEINNDAFMKSGDIFIMEKDKNRSFYLYRNAEEGKNPSPEVLKGRYDFKKLEANYNIGLTPHILLTINNQTCTLGIEGDADLLRDFFEHYMPEWGEKEIGNDEGFFRLIFKQDMTEKYQNKYPEAQLFQLTYGYDFNPIEISPYPIPGE